MARTKQENNEFSVNVLMEIESVDSSAGKEVLDKIRQKSIFKVAFKGC